MDYITMQESYLQHHGILGMHWGIRRYQNPDGSLTSAGKSRIKTYNKAEKLKSSGNKEKYKEFKSSNKKEIKEGKKLDIKVREQDLPFYQKSGFKKTAAVLAVTGTMGLLAASAYSGGLGPALFTKNPALGIGVSALETALQFKPNEFKFDEFKPNEFKPKEFKVR